MDKPLNWPDYFKIDTNSLPKEGGGSAVYRCLKKGMVGSTDYLNWAKQYYQLPVLKDDFFNAPANKDVWMETEKFHPWNRELVPIAKWQDVIYVACLKPPTQIQSKAKLVFVLASFNMIEKFYNQLNSSGQKKTEELPDGFFNKQDEPTFSGFPDVPDDIDDTPVDFQTHQTSVGKRVNDHAFVGVNIGKASPLGSLAMKYFSKITEKYQNVLLLEPRGDKLIVSSWDPTWQPRNPASEHPVLLDQPSIFKIVARSNQPYHGYVVGNKINDAFFENWSGKIPEHTTIVPILALGRVVGMLLAVGDGKNATRSSLQLCEQVAKKIAEKYEQAKKKVG